MKVRWKRIARRAKNASEFAQRIVASIGRLEHLPQSGSPMEEFPELGLNEIFVGVYRVIHRVDKYVSIWRIIHGSRRLTLSDLDVG